MRPLSLQQNGLKISPCGQASIADCTPSVLQMCNVANTNNCTIWQCLQFNSPLTTRSATRACRRTSITTDPRSNGFKCSTLWQIVPSGNRRPITLKRRVNHTANARCCLIGACVRWKTVKCALLSCQSDVHFEQTRRSGKRCKQNDSGQLLTGKQIV